MPQIREHNSLSFHVPTATVGHLNQNVTKICAISGFIKMLENFQIWNWNNFFTFLVQNMAFCDTKNFYVVQTIVFSVQFIHNMYYLDRALQHFWQKNASCLQIVNVEIFRFLCRFMLKVTSKNSLNWRSVVCLTSRAFHSKRNASRMYNIANKKKLV